MALPAAQVYAAGEGIVSKEEEPGVFTTQHIILSGHQAHCRGHFNNVKTKGRDFQSPLNAALADKAQWLALALQSGRKEDRK